MSNLTSDGDRLVGELSRRHGFSSAAVQHMLLAVHQGQGTQAQFSHPEFGGMGQWMRGGMIMLGDMFNNNLKARVDSLCHEISDVLGRQPGLIAASPQSNWWPAELGFPSASGSQNQMRYAYFPDQRRLAVDAGGEVWVYDTLDHQIGGFSQQQGTNSSIQFNSQYGTVQLSSLPVVLRNASPAVASGH